MFPQKKIKECSDSDCFKMIQAACDCDWYVFSTEITSDYAVFITVSYQMKTFITDDEK